MQIKAGTVGGWSQIFFYADRGESTISKWGGGAGVFFRISNSQAPLIIVRGIVG